MPGASKTALITGIHGFTGRYMREELIAAGYRVVGLGSNPCSDKDYRQADLLDAYALKQVLLDVQPDMIVHLAAIAFVGHGDANAFYQVNVLGTRNLLEAIVSMGKTPDRVLLASSANVYGNASEGVLSEKTWPAPANDYAVSKLAMEYMAGLYASKLAIVIARPFNYTGVGQANNFLIPKIVSHYRTKVPVIELGNIDVWRDFGDVRSVVQAYRRLLEAPQSVGQIVNVCSGNTYSLHEVLTMCERISGHKLTVQVNPEFVRSNEVKTLTGDTSRLYKIIGSWEPIPLFETLKWMLSASQ